MTQIIVADSARFDMQEIWHYIAQDNPAAAQKTINAFHEKFRLIAQTPLMGKMFDEIEPGLRRLVAGSYLFFYRHEKTQLTFFAFFTPRGISIPFLKSEIVRPSLA